MGLNGICAAITLLSGSSSHASFTVIKNFAAWSAAAGPSTTLDFVLPSPAIMSDQYAQLGVLFPDAEEWAYALHSFQQDGWGCKGSLGGDADVHIKFLQPQTSVGVWFPGTLKASLYWQGQLIYSSPGLDTFGQTYQFGGIVSTQPFDEVVFVDPSNFIYIDDILFASTVPAPASALALLGFGLGSSRRRRRQ